MTCNSETYILGTKSYVTGGDTCDFMATFVNLVNSNQGATKSTEERFAVTFPNPTFFFCCISSELEKMGGAMVIIDRETRGIEMKKVTTNFSF